MENIGVAPDFDIEQDPELVRKGLDPQLERAAQVVMEELKKSPPPKVRKPKYPDYHSRPAANRVAVSGGK